MIRHLVALDSQRGIAKNHAMPPWKLPQDEAYFTQKTLSDGGMILMGKKTFAEALQNRPLKNRTNYVVTHDTTPIFGAIVVNDLAAFIRDWPAEKVLWVIGGAEIFDQTLAVADELYITEINASFDCDKFYPVYKDGFELIHDSGPRTENGLTYSFRTYGPKVS